MICVKTLIVGQLQTNCYLVWDRSSQECVIVDPGDDASFIIDCIQRLSVRPSAVIATHGHFDHILGAFEVQHAFTIPFYIHPKDVFLLSMMQKSARHYMKISIVEPPPVCCTNAQWQDFTLTLGKHVFTILQTPGHTPGGIALYDPDSALCFTGDTVFAGGLVGDWRHKYSDKQALFQSVHMILSLPGQTVLYPGHGDQTSPQEEQVYQKEEI